MTSSRAPACGHTVSPFRVYSRQLTELAGLFVYKAISCPGSLGEGHFTSKCVLGGLHCLSDGVLSECKSVSSYFGLLLRPGKPQPYGFHIAESSASISSRCRNLGSPIKVTLRFQTAATGVEPVRAMQPSPHATPVQAGIEPTCNVTLVELGGIEPPSSTHPLQLPGSVSAAIRPSHCGPTKAHRVLGGCPWYRTRPAEATALQAAPRP